jgi:tetratricopeptide (TPR) repeat protein
LNEEYPELAEPYNNLAVLYAGQGDYDKARAALQAAVRSNPAYATAYENLGDVYLRLAARAYERAQALDAGRGALAPKVAQVKSLVPDRPPDVGGKTP